MKRSGRFIVLAFVVAFGLIWAGRTLYIGDKRESSHQPGRVMFRNGLEDLKARNGEQVGGTLQSEESQRQDRFKQTEGEQRSGATHLEARLEDQQPFRAPIDQLPDPVPPRLQAEAQPPGTKVQGVDFSVARRAFPVSESILGVCEPTTGSRPLQWCKPNEKLLDDMAEEPREEPWATEAERAIRALVELEPRTQMPRAVTYTIRALECRTSICFVETASVMGGFHTQLYYFEKTSGLKAEYAINSSETDEYGTEVHVTLWPFVRR